MKVVPLLSVLLLSCTSLAQQNCTTDLDCTTTQFCTIGSECRQYACETYHDLLGFDGDLSCEIYIGSVDSMQYACQAGTGLSGTIGWVNVEPENAVGRSFGQYCTATNSTGEILYCYDNENIASFDEFTTEAASTDLGCPEESTKFQFARFIAIGSLNVGAMRTQEFDLGFASSAIAVAAVSEGNDNPFDPVSGGGSSSGGATAASMILLAGATVALFL